MHCLRKISNRNSLQFCHYWCLNVAYVCYWSLFISIFNFGNAKQSGRLKSGEYCGWLSLLREQHTVLIVLLSTHTTQIAHKVFIFSNHQTECDKRWFLVSSTLRYHPTTSTAVIFQNSCRLSSVFIFFFFLFPAFCFSQSSSDSSTTTNWLCHRNTIARDTDESPNAFTNISHIFAAVNPALQQNFIAAHCSKFFSMVIYNTSTEHTMLQNALILPHIDVDFKLVSRRRRV